VATTPSDRSRRDDMIARLVAFAALGTVAAAAVWAQPTKSGDSPAAKLSHMVALPDDVKWGPAPPVLPAGAQAAVLDGDPSKAGLFTIRLKVPDGYAITGHWHSMVGHMTVVNGAVGLGLWDQFAA